jgi:DNA-binding transcriptional LysR family regulator
MVNIAQSAITKSIQELEEELRLKLFGRTAKGMLLT